MNILKKIKKAWRGPTRTLALVLGAVALALFVRVGVPAIVHAWTIYPVLSYTPFYAGQYTTVSWSAPTSDYCYLIGFAPGGGTVLYYVNGYYYYSPQILYANGSYTVGPVSSPFTYYAYCYNQSGGIGSSEGFGTGYVTAYPTTPTRSTPYISASPTGVTRGNSSTIYWSTSAGNNYSTGYLFGGGLDGYVSSSGSRSTGALNASTQYGYQVYDSYFGWETPAYVTVGAYNQPAMTASVTSSAGNASSGGSLTVPFGTQLNASATYAAGSGDTLTYSVLNVLPPSPGAEYNANYTTPYNQASRAYSFTPATPGTYVIKPYIQTTYGSGWLNMPGVNITVTVQPPPPTPSISATPATVDMNGTSTLAWSATNLAAGQCTLTAPSSGAGTTNFGAVTTGSRIVNYYSVNAVVDGWAYSMGGYNGSSYVPTAYKAPASSDLSNNANWSTAGAIPTSVALFDEPLYINGNLWNFGGVAFNTQNWASTICYVPASGGTLGAWSCPASLPTGMAQGYSNPVIIGDYIYRFGGYNYTTYAGGVASVARAPLSSPTSWTRYPNVLPQASGMYAHGVAVIGDYVYLFGGYNGSSYLNTIYRAPLSSDLTSPSSWTSGGVIPYPLISMGIVVGGDYLYLIGGHNGTGAVNSVYNIPLSTLAAGGVTQGSWGSYLSLPAARNLPKPLIAGDKLYLMGGWQNGVYANAAFSLPFNTGLPYTTPANMPWRVTGAPNKAVTWPLSANTTYALQCTNSTGSNSASAAVSIRDMCTDIPGFQNALPPGCTGPVPSPSGLCIPAGYMYDGSACVVAPPVIGSFFGPSRVRRGSTATLTYLVSNPPASCSITGTNGYSASVSPVDGVQGSVTTSPITANTVFTLDCDGVKSMATVGITPEYQEL